MKNLKKTFIISILMTLFSFTTTYSQWTSNGTSISNTNTGNVGIGTTTPSVKFHVYDNSSTQGTPIAMFGDGGTSDRYQFRADRGNGAEFYINSGIARFTSGGNMYFKNIYSTIDVMSLNSFGSVGIGTGTNFNTGINPNGYKLAVKGTIGAWSIRIENSSTVWADFVFNPNYKLLPISKIEEFIIQNRHLPDVPSEDEIKKDGFDVAKMDAILLRKIEELTLYIIEMKKENEELKRKVEKLEKK